VPEQHGRTNNNRFLQPLNIMLIACY
jgi:hypothetical protein